MKRLKTDELGLHPLTLQDFGFIQDSYFEGFKQTIKALVGNTPCVLWGMVEAASMVGLPPFTNTLFHLSEGAYWDGNEILYHQDSYVSIPGSSIFVSLPWRVNIDTNQNVLPPITYKNGQLKYVYRERYAWSGNTPGSGILLSSVPRLDTLLKQRLGINTINTNIANLVNDLANANGNIQGLIQDLANTNQNLNDHINQGGHTYKKISDRPFLYGSAYLSDPGAGLGTSKFNSAGYPLIGGVAQTNVRVVAQAGSSDTLYEIKLPNNAIINNAYHVYGSIVGVSQGWGSGNYNGYYWNNDNDVAFSIVKKDNNKFHLAVREYASQVQDLWFEFQVVDLSKV